MNTMLKNFLTSIVLLVVTSVTHAQQYSKVTYVHSDPDGSAFAATNEQGAIEWRIEHFPFGREFENTSQGRKSDISYAGKPFDKEIGLSYFGGRWHDPDAGRFTSIDPLPVQFSDVRLFNRYAYSFNNPYRYTDPDGNVPIDTIWDGVSIVYDIGKIGVGYATGNAKLQADGAVDLAADTAAFFIPYFPAGSSKIARATGDAVDKGFSSTSVIGKFPGGVVDLIKRAKPGKNTKGRSTLFDFSGGIKQANKEFDILKPKNVQKIETKFGPGRSGTLSDGSMINVRPGSSNGGPPTIEIIKGKNRTKFRFNED